MGLRSVAKDLGLDWKLTVLTDATAAIGVCKRRGLGKIRHLHTADLWIQDKLRCREFDLIKVAGKDNMADMLTKHTDRATLERHVHALGLRVEHGRAQSAPTLDQSISFITPDGTFRRRWSAR